MISISEGEVITCFYILTNYIGINSYKVDDNFTGCISIWSTYNKKIKTDNI